MPAIKRFFFLFFFSIFPYIHSLAYHTCSTHIRIMTSAHYGHSWQFQYTGLSVLPFIAATGFVYFVGGPVADRISNAVARRNGGGREPEHHLLNIMLPFVAGITGTFIFGWAGQANAHWAVLLVGSFLLVFAFLVVLSVINVYVVESYPMWAGPVLVNVSSLRIIIAFFLSSKSTAWVAQRGFLNTFVIYAEVMIVASIGIPILYLFGKRIRRWTAGKVQRVDASEDKALEKQVEDDASERASRP